MRRPLVMTEDSVGVTSWLRPVDRSRSNGLPIADVSLTLAARVAGCRPSWNGPPHRSAETVASGHFFPLQSLV